MVRTLFAGITLADPGVPLLITLMLTTPLYIMWQRFRQLNSDVWVRFVARALYICAIAGPLVPLTVLYVASWRASVVLGHWPLCMTDDPKFICDGDALYEQICSYVTCAKAFAGWSIISFVLLFLLLLNQVPKRRLLLMATTFLVAWLVFFMEPGWRFAWWLD